MLVIIGRIYLETCPLADGLGGTGSWHGPKPEGGGGEGWVGMQTIMWGHIQIVAKPAIEPNWAQMLDEAPTC